MQYVTVPDSRSVLTDATLRDKAQQNKYAVWLWEVERADWQRNQCDVKCVGDTGHTNPGWPR